MSADLDLCYSPATDLAARIRTGRLSPVEVIDNALARIDEVNPKLNGFCFVFPEEARAEAKAMEAEARQGKLRGPLHGVPFAIKDLTPTKGHRTTLGSHAYEHNVADHDATIVEALLRRDTPSGWASTMTVVLLVAGVQSMILGVLGEYVGRTFLSANGKPQGTVRLIRHGAPPETSPDAAARADAAP